MTSREQFEAWVKSETGFDLWRTNYPMTAPENQQYAEHSTNLAWMAWQASREAVEVDKIDGSRLAHVYLESTTADKVDAYVKGWNACIDRIKVKVG